MILCIIEIVLMCQLTDDQVKNIEYYKPDENSIEIKYLKERRLQLGGFIPERSTFAKPIKAPPKDIFDNMKFRQVKKKCRQLWL